jgi:superfamily II DNA/RNA helicase
MNTIKKQNFEKPTIIQSVSWPILLSGHDIVGIAQTGSGKTLGFVVPLIMHILHQKKKAGKSYSPAGPIALIIAPTRELAMQIQAVADTFGRPLNINNMCLYGGAARGPQKGQMQRGADICIATPGRLLDFLKERLISLSDTSFLVLDEADRMLDMGFEPQITKVIQMTRVGFKLVKLIK